MNFIKYIKEDIKEYDKNNESEMKVLNAHYFSSYKGIFAVKTNLKRSGSLKILFISQYASFDQYKEDIVRHEYGHIKQLEILGLLRYISCIGIPSLFQLGNDKLYYRRPWELSADLFGDVKSRNYLEYKEQAFYYLEQIKQINLFTFIFYCLFKRQFFKK